jgi:hypothetical protein
MSKLEILIKAIKKEFSCGGEYLEKWLDRNSKKINLDKIVDEESALVEIRKIKTK